MQKCTLDIGGKLPDKSSCVHISAKFACDSNFCDHATIFTEIKAQSEHGLCTLNKSQSGAVNVEAELKGRYVTVT